MWDFFKRLRNAIADRQQKAAIVAAPIVLNPNDELKVHLAIDRLDAIRRHLEQKREAGITVAETRLREFRAEARGHAAFLLMRGRIDEQGHDLLLKTVGIG